MATAASPGTQTFLNKPAGAGKAFPSTGSLRPLCRSKDWGPQGFPTPPAGRYAWGWGAPVRPPPHPASQGGRFMSRKEPVVLGGPGKATPPTQDSQLLKEEPASEDRPGSGVHTGWGQGCAQEGPSLSNPPPPSPHPRAKPCHLSGSRQVHSGACDPPVLGSVGVSRGGRWGQREEEAESASQPLPEPLRPYASAQRTCSRRQPLGATCRPPGLLSCCL